MLELQSHEIDQLTAAFVEARKQVIPVEKDGKANFGKFVSLGEIKACTNEALLANGLSLTQLRTFHEGHTLLVTKLTHVSGQWIAGYTPLYIPENPKDIQQAYGTACTYQRRYELYGLFQIKDDDLDPDTFKEETPEKTHMQSDCISDKQLGMLKMLLKSQPEREAKICQHYKIASLEMLPWRHMQEVVNTLKPRE